jgi:alkylated DNA repair dioxygenase AlkB
MEIPTLVDNKIKCLYPLINGEYTFICYYPNFLNYIEKNKLNKWLQEKKYKEGKSISGKEIPRLQLWYQQENKYFCELWKYRYDRWQSHDYDELLYSIQDKVNILTNQLINEYCPFIAKPKINSCLVNKYRSGNDSIKPHRDTPDSFGEYPTIIGLSIGGKRKIVFKKIDFDRKNYNSMKVDRKSALDFEMELEDNSLFIMGGASQKYYSHEIPKSDSNDTRYSLTFREFIY